jgi:uncharacterized protein (DUF1697 family)
MATNRCVALLRGINVGGKNPVKMDELRACFEADGHTEVRTYIQSGNVLFTTTEPVKTLEDRVESALEKQFGVPLLVVVRTHRQLRNVFDQAPPGFGSEPDKYHSDAIFLKAPLTASQAMKVVTLRDGVDRAWPGKGLIYFTRLSELRTKSKMNKIVGTPEYKQMTIRSWSTTTKLLAMLDE